MLNQTIIQGFQTIEEFYTYAHTSTVPTAIFLSTFLTFLILLIVGLSMVKYQRMKYLTILIISFLAVIIINIGIIYMPHSSYYIGEIFSQMWK